MTRPSRNEEDKVSFLGLHFTSRTLNELTQEIVGGRPEIGIAYHLVNAYTLVEAEQSSKLLQVLTQDELLCDGKPLARLLQYKNPKVTQIRGSDLMRNVICQSSTDVGHFFLGSTIKVLDCLITAAKHLNPDILVVGQYSPPFEVDSRASVDSWIKMIRESGADVVWVGLGTPKQDYISNEIALKLNVRVIAVGAAFDYLAGNFIEAPKVFQVLWLEWFYRLMKEPRRLGRRYLIGNLKFLRLCILSHKELTPKRDS